MTAAPHMRSKPVLTHASTYCGLFLLALATLLLEILITRMTSVIAWYHLAFFVISLAMLGLTAGALVVFLRPGWFTPGSVTTRMAQASLGFALATPLCTAVALALPLTPVVDFMGSVALFASGTVLALPFAFAGIALTIALTCAGLPPGKAYGVDLLGAATGCALVIPALALLDAPSAALIAAAVGALAAGCFARAAGGKVRTPLLVALGCIGIALTNASARVPPLRPAWVKGEREQPNNFLSIHWNSHSRVTVEPLEGAPVLWGVGENTPLEVLAPIEQRTIEIDGAAGTVMACMGAGPEAHGYLAWDLTALVHALRPRGRTAVIGVGGGHDVLAAARRGPEPIVGIELNGAIVDLHRSEMADFSGLAALPYVELVHDEARSYLARDRRRYGAIVMSLIDTWASTGTGAYNLSENGLYTMEAWRTFLGRLTPDGILAVSRWYYESNPGETARMLALSLATLWWSGIEAPQRHVVVLQNRLVATLLLSRRPFPEEELRAIRDQASERGFHVRVAPGEVPSEPLLAAIVAQPSREALGAWADSQRLDLSPPTDARPFFFNMLRPRDWLTDAEEIDHLDLPFLGNLQATASLGYAICVALLLALLTLVAPLLARVADLRSYPRRDVAAALAYFALIGVGFMFVEIGLLSRLNVFLGHPTLALAVLLAGLIVFAGCGSLLSSRVPIDRRAVRFFPLVPALFVLLANGASGPVMHAFAAASTPMRVIVSVGVIAFPALSMGVCFPLGLRLVERLAEARGEGTVGLGLGPWLWATNGAFGVVASGLALASSMAWGVPTTLALGGACYLLLAPLTLLLARARS